VAGGRLCGFEDLDEFRMGEGKGTRKELDIKGANEIALDGDFDGLGAREGISAVVQHHEVMSM